MLALHVLVWHCWLGYLLLLWPWWLLWWLKSLLVLFSLSCFVQLPFFAVVFLRWPCVSLCVSSILSLPCVRLLVFFFKYHVLLLTIKDDNITGSLSLCHLFYKLNLIMISAYIYVQECIYVQLSYVQITIMYIGLCSLLFAICVACHWLGIYSYLYVSIWILFNHICIFITVCYLIISLQKDSFMCSCSVSLYWVPRWDTCIFVEPYSDVVFSKLLGWNI